MNLVMAVSSCAGGTPNCLPWFPVDGDQQVSWDCEATSGTPPIILIFGADVDRRRLIFLTVLATMNVPGASLNIYTQVGLVTLMGLISKHGILIVEVANELQRQGRSRREAVEQAAAIRLRPILMTTAAMVLGVMPLVLASGAGALSRFSMGLVIPTSIVIGTLFMFCLECQPRI